MQIGPTFCDIWFYTANLKDFKMSTLKSYKHLKTKRLKIGPTIQEI